MPNRYAPAAPASNRAAATSASRRPPVSSSSNGRRPTTSRTTDSASGRRASSPSATSKTNRRSDSRIGRVDRKLKRRRQLDVAAVAGQQEGRRRRRGSERPAVGRLPPQRLDLGRAGRAEADLQAADPVGCDRRDPLDRPGPAQVQARPEHAAIPAEPLEQADFVRADRGPAARGVAQRQRAAHAHGKKSLAGGSRSTPSRARGRCGRRAGRSTPRARASCRNGGSSAQSPKTSSRIELSKTSSEPTWWRIAAATGPRMPNVADSIATALSPKAKPMMFCRMMAIVLAGQAEQVRQHAERVAQHDQVAGLGGQVRADAPQGDAGVGLGQGRCIVDPVADHGHAVPGLLSLLDPRALSAGSSSACTVSA